jgi:hypothetical protein
VLLIDGDEEHPALDLLLGASTMEEDLWPSARLDHVLLRLADLASGATSLERLLWGAPAEWLQALFGRTPIREATPIGVEHLDYLYRYHLNPGARTMVVDGGTVGPELSTSTRFYVSMADWVVVVTHEGDQYLRSCLWSLDRVLSVPGRRRVAVVMCVAGGVVGGPALRRLERSAAGCWSRPWVPTAAQLAARRRRPLAEVDRKVLAAVDQVLGAVSVGSAGPE